MAYAPLYQAIEIEEKHEDGESDGTSTDMQLKELRQQLKEAKDLAIAEKEAAVAEKEAAVAAAVTENDAKHEAALMEQQMKTQYQGPQVSTCRA